MVYLSILLSGNLSLSIFILINDREYQIKSTPIRAKIYAETMYDKEKLLFFFLTHTFLFSKKELLADIIINITNISQTWNKWWGKYNEKCSGFVVINTKEQCNNLVNVSKFGESNKRENYIFY